MMMQETGRRQACVQGNHRIRVVAAAVAVWLLASLAGAQTRATIQEDTAKAAFLYHITLFVQWPATPAGSPLTICTADDGELGDRLAALLRERSSESRPVKARQVDERADVTDCSVLFVAGSMSAARTALILGRAQGSVLTVGETVQFLRDGGMIRLFVEQEKLRFQVVREAAERRGLRLSSQFLALAAR